MHVLIIKHIFCSRRDNFYFSYRTFELSAHKIPSPLETRPKLEYKKCEHATGIRHNTTELFPCDQLLQKGILHSEIFGLAGFSRFHTLDWQLELELDQSCMIENAWKKLPLDINPRLNHGWLSVS